MSASDKSAPGETPDLRNFSGPLVLVGAGKMGGALLEGWLRFGLDPESSRCSSRSRRRKSQRSPAAACGSIRMLRALTDVAAIVVAVKPQIAGEAMPSLAPMIGAATLVVSIMAGRTLRFLSGALQRPCALVRAMPNTPAAIGRGITVAVRAARERRAARARHRLLSATGAVEWIEDEALMDAVTAVSGSGPAYVFLLAEALAQAGAAAGLPPHLAEKLARETVAGSGELLHRSPLEAATLRENVTSPGGTTAAALEVLMGEEGLADLMKTAIAAATRRSRELAG